MEKRQKVKISGKTEHSESSHICCVFFLVLYSSVNKNMKPGIFKLFNLITFHCVSYQDPFVSSVCIKNEVLTCILEKGALLQSIFNSAE